MKDKLQEHYEELKKERYIARQCALKQQIDRRNEITKRKQRLENE